MSTDQTLVRQKFPHTDAVTGSTTSATLGMRPTITVIICAYTDQRWEELKSAVRSVQSQTCRPNQVVVVIDYNPVLLSRALDEFTGVLVAANREAKGLAGARNTGLSLSHGEIVTFLDDDARADSQWLVHLIAPYESQSIHGTGGMAIADWAASRPRWFPSEFEWVVGCSYRGLPTVIAPIRNPIGASMSFRRSVFDAVGNFDIEMGRVATIPLGCEETLLGIRVIQYFGEHSIVQVPDAVVHHKVGIERTRIKYFASRCFAEGVSKAVVAKKVGASDASSVERRYVSRVLTGGLIAGLAQLLRGKWSGLATSVMILLGLTITTVGYGLGRIGLSTYLIQRLIGDVKSSKHVTQATGHRG